ncbi:septation protein SpoVG family protein [Candidatus Pacearchaeota archaeon]|nr:septation protein SpoVG family protein [Candidatus Pacearchaeota archaeon]
MDIKVKKINKITTNPTLKAFVDISINDMIVIKGLRVIVGKEGLTVCMPTEKDKDNRWYPTVKCLPPFDTKIKEIVLEAYHRKGGA